EPAPRQVIERPERRGREAAPYDEPAARPRRRRRRLRIPFKKTIIFVVLVLLLLSAADQIASMVDEQRSRLWDKATTSVRNDVNDQLDSWWNRTKDTFTGSSGGG
ncbi:serine/threonine protein kinase, partial [Frankia sp. AgKG'84/4]|nr:serine/threonine protein kinase [Frankia sp. AgKG'84/4]